MLLLPLFAVTLALLCRTVGGPARSAELPAVVADAVLEAVAGVAGVAGPVPAVDALTVEMVAAGALLGLAVAAEPDVDDEAAAAELVPEVDAPFVPLRMGA